MRKQQNTHGITSETRATNTEYSDRTRENKKKDSLCDLKAGHYQETAYGDT